MKNEEQLLNVRMMEDGENNGVKWRNGRQGSRSQTLTASEVSSNNDVEGDNW
jgi:hypothetical protein